MNIFQKIGAFFVRFFTGAVKQARKFAPLAVEITAKLKELVENPALDVITSLIPGSLDNAAVLAARKAISQVATKLAIAHGIIGENDRNHDVVGRLVAYLKGQHPELQTNFWIRFAGELNVAFADGKIDIAEGVALTQMMYLELIKKKGEGK